MQEVYKRATAIVTLLCFVSMLFSACNWFKSDETLIRERIDSFITAYNTGDMEGVIECLDAKTRNTYKSAINIAESLGGAFLGIGLSMSDLFGLGIGLMSNGDALTLNIHEISINGSSATVTASMDTALYAIGEEYSSSQNVFLTLVKEGSDWFISDLSNY